MAIANLRRGLMAVALLAGISTAIGLAWHSRFQPPRFFEVAGPSMVPTLVGPSLDAHCQRCRSRTRVSPTAATSNSIHHICSLCGGTLHLADSPIPPDIVEIEPVASGAALSRGMLVALENDHLMVKRIAGIEGDEIGIDQSTRQLTLNAIPLIDALAEQLGPENLPTLLVDRDAGRDVSRWVGARGWNRDESGRWRFENDHATQSAETWLVYHHQSVHDHNLPSRIMDDYPFNVGVTRKLIGVDRFRVSAEVRSDMPVELEVAFWSHDGPRSTTLKHCQGEFSATSFQSIANASLPVTPTTPVAIRVDAAVMLTDIILDRFVQYRLRPRDDDSLYPLKLARGQLFVVGDNVPVSKDSREFGAVSTKRIVGTVSPARSGQ